MTSAVPFKLTAGLVCFGGTHQGRVRPINEDRFLCDSNNGIFAVADGMGGHSHGDIASSAIVQTIEEESRSGNHTQQVKGFIDSVANANTKIHDISRANDDLTIGSTVVGLVVSDGMFSVLWTGDSRAYLIRDGRIKQLTIDHTEAQMLLRQGTITEKEAELWPRKNVIVHAVGVDQVPHIEVSQGEVRHNDCFVLCSDGLTNHVNDSEILSVVSEGSAENSCKELIKTSLHRGGKDNITTIVVNCTE